MTGSHATRTLDAFRQFRRMADLKGFGFDLRSLEVFVATAQTGNMTMAATQLGLTQSSVSQTLSALEQNLNVALLDRSVRPVELTVAGRYFYDQSCHLLAEAEKTHGVMTQGNFQKLHLLRIAMVDSLATSLGQPLVEVIKRHTENWRISTGRSHMHAQSLLSRSVDIIISDDALDNHEHLSRHRILREPFVLVIPNLFTAQFQQLHQVVNRLDFVRYTSDSLIGVTIERYLRRQNLNVPVRMQLDNTFAVLTSVAAGLGWTITTPLCLFQCGPIRDKLTCLPLPGDEPFFRNLTLVSRHHELGNLPQILANDSRQIINENFLPRIRDELPWLEHEFYAG
ncbi:LysR family transcriptional regulator [Photobacterium sp. CCB-ST2H9]|uniref:LysR family transcriptional regulator n=1 Tax=Photobacterium sp. CCB-ST2H9 TaxID=2912855 RepID=UPI00200598FC|nr:LysR family transcriptional regulator [Photobacterium sp. CCB-ST2H9]UTM59507.1 LysR family transcriptional regulator [Photobacterium sp. CCB-ST2H9]